VRVTWEYNDEEINAFTDCGTVACRDGSSSIGTG
jgi:hypothetical protein